MFAISSLLICQIWRPVSFETRRLICGRLLQFSVDVNVHHSSFDLDVSCAVFCVFVDCVDPRPDVVHYLVLDCHVHRAEDLDLAGCGLRPRERKSVLL